MLSRFVETLRARNTVNTDIFCASEAQNHGIYDVFALVAKIMVFTCIYHVFWPVPSKNSGIYTFSIPKAQKHCKTDKKLAGSLHA